MSITVSCPSCERTLRVPEKLLGQRVKCPACQETFTAAEGGGASAGVKKGPSDVRRPPPEEYEEEAPRRRRDEEDYDDDYEERPRRRRRGGGLKPHRGQTILILGILSFFFAWPILGIVAWVMGNTDLKEIQAGRMDPEGESQTKTGRMCGMISTLAGAGLFLLGCLCWAGFMFLGVASSGAR